MRALGGTLTSTFQWLGHLKSSQLKSIAQAIGIRTAGPKPALTLRLQRELAQCQCLPPELAVSKGSSVCQSVGQNGARKDRGRDLSLLSIDMGIQNLAFAHLLVPGPATKSTSSSDGPVPTLTAWHRLAVSAFPRSSALESFSLPLSTFPLSGSISKKSKKSVEDETSTLFSEEEEAIASTTSDDHGGMSFSPDLYAEHAYTLITSLLATYKPTHILIERQRFRSGGASAVQEWTLRVGVFEGMLYAVLHTLARERGHSVFVQSVSPSRVARYWYGDADPDADAFEATQEKSKTKKKKRMTSREGKKAKIDLVGKWLSAWETNIGPGVTSASLSEVQKINIGPDDNVKRVVSAYLRKWQGKKARSHSIVNSDKESETDIGKLDDLADCLLQGITWLDWHVARGKILRDGADAAVVKDIIHAKTARKV